MAGMKPDVWKMTSYFISPNGSPRVGYYEKNSRSMFFMLDGAPEIFDSLNRNDTLSDRGIELKSKATSRINDLFEKYYPNIINETIRRDEEYTERQRTASISRGAGATSTSNT